MNVLVHRRTWMCENTSLMFVTRFSHCSGSLIFPFFPPFTDFMTPSHSESSGTLLIPSCKETLNTKSSTSIHHKYALAKLSILSNSPSEKSVSYSLRCCYSVVLSRMMLYQPGVFTVFQEVD